MYLPEHFKETNPERIAEFIRDYAFGILVTAAESSPFASHLPFIFDHAVGAHGRLLCHMARANPQWRHFSTGGEVLVVFQGPHAYVSPSWYGSTGVPTWNYAVAHLRGKPRLIESESELEALVIQLTDAHESHRQNPWQSSLEGDRRVNLLGMIVGFEIEVTDIQAKFKLSQNRPPEDQKNVAEMLSLSTDQTELALAKLMSNGRRAKNKE
jgi:transcriptional regulator